jgi:hypothetical protein
MKYKVVQFQWPLSVSTLMWAITIWSVWFYILLEEKKAYFRTCVLMSVSYAHPTHCPICDLLVLMKTYSPIDLSSLPLPRISLSLKSSNPEIQYLNQGYGFEVLGWRLEFLCSPAIKDSLGRPIDKWCWQSR